MVEESAVEAAAQSGKALAGSEEEVDGGQARRFDQIRNSNSRVVNLDQMETRVAQLQQSAERVGLVDAGMEIGPCPAQPIVEHQPEPGVQVQNSGTGLVSVQGREAGVARPESMARAREHLSYAHGQPGQTDRLDYPDPTRPWLLSWMQPIRIIEQCLRFWRKGGLFRLVVHLARCELTVLSLNRHSSSREAIGNQQQ